MQQCKAKKKGVLSKLGELTKKKKSSQTKKKSKPATTANNNKEKAKDEWDFGDLSSHGKEELEKNYEILREQIIKQMKTAKGLERLIEFYASDPAQQQKTQKELKEMEEKISKMKEKKEELTRILEEKFHVKQNKAHSTAESGAGPVHTVKALYDFIPEGEGELAFKVGDTITLLDWTDPDWWHGELNGLQGVFPASYVESTEDTASSPAEVATTVSNDDVLTSNPDALSPALSEEPIAATSGSLQVTALYDFAGDNEGELGFKAGDSIALIDWADSEWWKGELNGQQGVFPASYVETTEQQQTSSFESGDSISSYNRCLTIYYIYYFYKIFILYCHVMCYVLCVMCYVLCVMCYVLCVMC